MRGACKTHPVPEYQADAVLSQANPVSGTKYVVLATTKNARIMSIHIVCTWTVQPTPLEVHLTIDGLTITGGFVNPVSTTSYYARHSALAQSLYISTADPSAYMAFLMEGRSIKVEVEITGGTVSNLSARVKYAKW